MRKIITILGARPQFIKASVVSRKFAEKGIEEIIVHTGQHFDQNMSNVFFTQMMIPEPKYNLGIHSLNHGAMTGRMIEKIEDVIIKEKPECLIIYGDTNSTIAGALAAKKLMIKVAHIEAGLRSFNMNMPEEINRILTDRISDYLFCPTDQSVENLKKEGFDFIDAQVIKSGDVMQDAAMYFGSISENNSSIIEQLNLKNDQFVLCTIHRQENTDNIENLVSIVKALNRINKEIQVVVPIHPRTRKIIEHSELDISFTIIDPVGYFDIAELLKNTKLVITDSGGLQKEAFFFQKHCITTRTETEWVELVENGFNIVAGTQPDQIYKAFLELREKTSDFNMDLYGNGKASEIITNELING